MRRPSLTLRAKMVTLIIGLVGVELAILPALLVALVSDNLLGLRNSGINHWIMIVVYAGLTLYVIVRLFPWHEVQVMVAEPNATLRDIMAQIVAKDHKR